MALEIGSIGGISPRYGSLDDPLATRGVARSAEAGGASFGEAVGQALDALQSLQGAADATAVDAVSGGPSELHDAMIAAEQLNLGFQLTLQLRNKVVEAYQEIMRMQV